MSAIANQQILADCDSQFAQTIDLRDERDRINDYAVADHANFPAPQDSRRNQVKNVFGTPMDNRVSGIVAALAADDNVGLGGEHVDDLPLSFIAPLRPN